MFRLDGADAVSPPPPTATLSSSLSPSPYPPSYVDRLVPSFAHPSPPPPSSYDWWTPCSSFSYSAVLPTRSSPLGSGADAAWRSGSYASVAAGSWGSAESLLGSVSDIGLERPKWPLSPRIGRFDRRPSWLMGRPLGSRPISSYGAAEYFSPKQVQDTLPRASSTLDRSIFEAGYSVSQCENPYRVNHDFISSLPNAGEKYKKLSADSFNMNIDDDNSMNNSLMVNRSSECSDSTCGNHSELSFDLLYGSKSPYSNGFNSLGSGCGSGESARTTPTSSDLLDQHNFCANSPCWKGAPCSCEFTFSAVDRLDSRPVSKNPGSCSRFDQGEDYLPAGVELESPSSLEHVESSICNDYQKDGSCSVVSRSRCPKSEVNKTEMSGDVEVTIMQNPHCGIAFGDQCDQAREQQGSDSGPNNCNMNNVGQQEDASLINQPLAHSETASLQIGTNTAVQANCSHSVKDIQLLVKTILGMSKLRLFNLFGGINNLKEQDRELIQLVINNLQALIDRSNKTSLDQSEISNADGSNFSNNKNMKENIHGIECAASNCKVNNFVVKGVDADLREFVTEQALDMVLNENYFRPEEDSEVLLYKKLWVEAEVALSLTKYELQCASGKNKHKQKENLDESSDVEQKPSQSNKLLSSMHDIDEFNEPSCKGNQSMCTNIESHQVDQNKAKDIDTSIMARFRLKNEWTDNSDSTTMEEHVKFLDSTSAEVEGCMGGGQTIHDLDLDPDGGKTQVSVTFIDTEHDFRISTVRQENEQSAKYTECGTTTEYPVCIADQPDLPYISSICGSKAFAGMPDSQFSDWEHVTKEEIAWYNGS